MGELGEGRGEEEVGSPEVHLWRDELGGGAEAPSGAERNESHVTGFFQDWMECGVQFKIVPLTEDIAGGVSS